MIDISATELARFMACNGSRLLGGSMPPSNDDPAARNEGTAAHWVVNEAFRWVKPLDHFLNQRAPNGVTITNAILRSVADYYDHITRKTGNVEQVCSFEFPAVAQINARCDFYSFDQYTLEVDDFKHGFRIVEPKENWTLLAYLYGLTQTFGISPQVFVCRVHQPRVAHPDGPVREWRMTRNEFENRIVRMYTKLANPSDDLWTGDHCGRCKSQTICPAFRAATYNAIDVSMTAHSESITDDMIALELATVQDAEKRIKSRKKQLEDLAAYRIKTGSLIDGFAVEKSFGNLTWNEGMTPEFLSAMTGVDCARVDSITPTQAIAAGANETLVKSISNRLETGFKLNRISAQKQAEKLFGKKGI